MKEVSSLKFIAQETFEINDLNHLSSGIYILNATSATGSASTRIVKQ
jgi:hypothetical protein